MLLSEKFDLINKDLIEMRQDMRIIRDQIRNVNEKLRNRDEIVGEFPAQEGYDVVPTLDGRNFVYLSTKYTRPNQEEFFQIKPPSVIKTPWYKRLCNYVCNLSK